MEAKKVLTGFPEEPISHPELSHLLAAAGLELWQSPAGFWAVRLKQPSVAAPAVQLRRRILRRTK
jgi:hypothetical protein